MGISTCGYSKRAAAPSPSAKPITATPIDGGLPQSVMTRASFKAPRVTLRTQWLNKSAMIKLPQLSRARPAGQLKRAVAPSPSTKPASLSWLPHNVDTAPEPLGELSTRMQWLFKSQTNTVPRVSTAIPHGWWKRTSLPCSPSANPETLPATVETLPFALTLRRRWLKVSATNKLPSRSTTIPQGWLNLQISKAQLDDSSSCCIGCQWLIDKPHFLPKQKRQENSQHR